MASTAIQSRLVEIGNGRPPVRVYEGGEGPELLYLHGAGGLLRDDPFVAALAKTFRVSAPLLPGFEDSDGGEQLIDMLDFSLHCFDVWDALGLSRPLVVGHSMGGMIAAEMAAIAPNDIDRLALICPAGIWVDELPIPDLFASLPFELPGLLFHDVAKNAHLLSAGGDLNDPQFLTSFMVQNSRRMTTAGKILFPIPDRGLAERLYRVKARTQLIWGSSDRLIPPAYAPIFAGKLRNAEIVSIAEAGHMVPYEQTEQVVAAIARLHN